MMIKKRRICSDRLSNNNGSTLIMAFLVLVVFGVFGAGFVLIGLGESRVAEKQKRTTMAFYLAEAGIERAFYDLKRDFIIDSTPSWTDGTINTYNAGPNYSQYYDIGYDDNTLNGGTYSVALLNISGQDDEIWVQSTGSYGGSNQTIRVYVKIVNISVWNNALFAGSGQSGKIINGNVDLNGSVHILGTGLDSTDYAVDLGGSAEIIGNNYLFAPGTLAAKVSDCPTTVFGGEVVSTLNAELRVRRGIVGLSGAATAGQENITDNNYKETIDGSYVTDGFGGTAGTDNVHSDVLSSYDLGNSIEFPSLSDPYEGYATFEDYFKANALIVSSQADLDELADITEGSNFTISGVNGSISMDGNGNMVISGQIYINGGDFNFTEENDSIIYTGKGAVYVTGDVLINSDLVTPDYKTFPQNILGVMTPNNITMGVGSQIDVMGMFYAENMITMQKQTDLMGSIVANYFDLGSQNPAIYQVPAAMSNLPPGLIGQDDTWRIVIVAWQKI
ncbi:MAG: hypothetical protein ABIJ41_00660 [Candidatus Omnitrophota bacterium]